MNTRAGAQPSTLQQLREAAGLTQQEVAAAVNAHIGKPHHGPVAAGQVSRWERRQQRPGAQYQRALANLYKVTIADLGLSTAPAPRPRPALAFLDEEPAISTADPRVTHSQDDWRGTRRALNIHRPALARLAAGTYPAHLRLADTGLLTTPGWLPDAPVNLTSIRLDWRPDAPSPAVVGTEPESAHTRPRHTLTRPYARYTQAIRDLEQPRLFANRETWRLLNVDWAAGAMAFGPTSYFAAVDVCEAVAHETAMVGLGCDDRPIPGPLAVRDMPLRRLIGDPFNPARLPVTPAAISTLTMRGGPDPAFLLHRRDASSVAIAGGSLHVIPSGVFQPSSVPAVLDQDFDLWRSTMREISEELLGNAEHGGDGEPADYDAEPFATLDAARRSGSLRIHCLGVGLDGLTLFGEILTVAVLDPDLFDLLAADFVEVNDEGTVIAERLPFTEDVVGRVLSSGQMHPAGAACVSLAWRHRGALLG